VTYIVVVEAFAGKGSVTTQLLAVFEHAIMIGKHDDAYVVMQMLRQEITMETHNLSTTLTVFWARRVLTKTKALLSSHVTQRWRRTFASNCKRIRCQTTSPRTTLTIGLSELLRTT